MLRIRRKSPALYRSFLTQRERAAWWRLERGHWRKLL